MKYLKRFNEELKSSTYLSASRKLIKFGNETSIKRADALKDWAIETEKKEAMVKWEENVKEYSKFGAIKCKVNNDTIDFYCNLTFDGFGFEENLQSNREEDPDNFKSNIFFFGWLIPATKEGVEKSLESIDAEWFDNGAFQAFYLSIDFTVENGVVTFNNLIYDKEDEVNINLTSNAASKVLNMIYKIFNDRNFNYPSSDTRYENEYQSLNATICMENGFSSDYGFELNDVAEYVKTVPKQKLM